MHHSHKLLAAIITVLVLTAGGMVRADDWPQWRGPHRDGISQEKGLLQQWPQEGPKLLWEANAIGFGFATPSVVADHLYLLSNKGLDDEFVAALSVTDGKPLWTARLGRVGNPNQQPNYPAARSTPTVDSDVLYALGSDGDLVCLQINDGKERWRKNVRKDFGGQPGTWAYAESPLVDGDKLVCTPGGPDATIVALNKSDGQVIWKCAVPGGDQAAYSSIVVADVDGAKQYVQFLQHGVVGVDANSGKFLWRYDQTANGSPANIPTPVAHDAYVYTGASMSGGGLVKLTSTAGAVSAQPVYFDKKLPTAIGGSVLIGDYLYGATARSIMCVQFATGTVKWQDRGIGAASVLYADRRLYLHGEDGAVALVEATPGGYHEKGRFTPPDQPDRGNAKAWAYPVVANGKMYIRDQNMLWCYDVAEAK